MGKMKNHVYGWLEDYGFALGYDMSNTPIWRILSGWLMIVLMRSHTGKQKQ